MAAAHAGIDVDLVPIKTEEKPADLMVANPLGKIRFCTGRWPSIHDSRAITQHLNRMSKNALLAQSRQGWRPKCGGAGRHLRLRARWSTNGAHARRTWSTSPGSTGRAKITAALDMPTIRPNCRRRSPPARYAARLPCHLLRFAGKWVAAAG
jgi:hypothetical protein